MSTWHRTIREPVQRLLAGDLDLWLLVCAAGLFTVLGIIDVAGPSALSSAVLALLALLAVAQVRSRREVAEIARSQQIEPTALLLDQWPADLAERRNAARDVLLIGTTMARTIQTYRSHLGVALAAGGRVRVLVLDPDIHDRLEQTWPVERHFLPGGRRRIENTLAELADIQASAPPGSLEVRIAPFWLGAGFNVLDPATPRGFIVFQYYEFGGSGEPAPIIALSADDGRWYQHFLSQAERMWAAGVPRSP
jgi:hypothetical protein